MPHQSIVQPHLYQIHIKPDMQRFDFSGRVDIHLTADAPITQLPLDAKELAIWQCQIRQNDGWSQCRFRIDSRGDRSLVQEQRVAIPRHH